MPTLRKCLKHPGTYLAGIAFVALAVTADSLRPPERQLSVGVYLAAVGAYQRLGSPVLEGYVRCRYSPTCSRYSAGAVQKYGLRKGLIMTAARLWRCRRGVPLGARDPVP
jgi:putative component of membrane protein insertase Oxa1/YidC/SpoIIIJ protein YidD